MEEIVQSEEMLEVADPVESEETLEVADPEEPDKSDAAFAQFRRENQEYKERISDMETQLKRYDEALGFFFDGEGDEKIVNAMAYNFGKNPDDIKQEFNAIKEKQTLEQENEIIKEELNELKIQSLMAKSLEEIQKLDPEVKTLDELGEDFPKFIMAGLTDVDAYYAVKAKMEKTRVNAPPVIGKVNTAPQEKDFFTKEEVERMTPSEVSKYYDVIRKSQSKW